ncbi:MAG: hypothetical protein JST89_00485 [Cyanobacteria bacterium SZAS-4]|nr:hypothetical protein [Cyanobacteria bacterium SZAS-4]
MGRDIVASAKEFEDHAQKGYLPENLANELHNMSGADRLAVAKQIEWDMKHQLNAALPKIEFYDTGDLKSVETSGQSGSTAWTDHVELDKNSGKVRAEAKTDDTKLSYERITSTELTVKDTNGNTTQHYETSTRVSGVDVKISSNNESWSYDAKSGKMLTHDQATSYGKKLHEEYDATTGKEKSADEVNSNGTVHRTYDPNTGKLRQEDLNNNDKSHETIKYNSNGDRLSREKQYGVNGSQGTREWVYSPRTGKEVYSEWRDPNGKVEKHNIDENGKWTRIED